MKSMITVQIEQGRLVLALKLIYRYFYALQRSELEAIARQLIKKNDELKKRHNNELSELDDLLADLVNGAAQKG